MTAGNLNSLRALPNRPPRLQTAALKSANSGSESVPGAVKSLLPGQAQPAAGPGCLSAQAGPGPRTVCRPAGGSVAATRRPGYGPAGSRRSPRARLPVRVPHRRHRGKRRKTLIVSFVRSPETTDRAEFNTVTHKGQRTVSHRTKSFFLITTDLIQSLQFVSNWSSTVTELAPWYSEDFWHYHD